MKILDAKGLKCPMPLIETKKALKEIEKDESLKIIVDNETSVKNVEHFLIDNGMEVDRTESDGIFEIVVNKQEGDWENVQAETYCAPASPTDDSYSVMFAKDRLGEGSQELGNVLVGGFLTTLNERELLPQKIMFMNSGINLVLNDSPAFPLLKELEGKGVDLVSCGTCLDYFGKMDELAVGRVSNMYEILESMLEVGKVINI